MVKYIVEVCLNGEWHSRWDEAFDTEAEAKTRAVEGMPKAVDLVKHGAPMTIRVMAVEMA